MGIILKSQILYTRFMGNLYKPKYIILGVNNLIVWNCSLIIRLYVLYMVVFMLEILFWSLCIYGMLSLTKDIIDANTYNKISHNIKLIITVKDVEDGIENYIRELNFGKNFYNNLAVIDLDSKDRTKDILQELQKDCLNIKILSKDEGKKYVEEAIH